MEKKLWEMTKREFAQAAKRGKINTGTGKKVRGENQAKSWLSCGELNGYCDDDIAHFYVNWFKFHTKKFVGCGWRKLLVDAGLVEKRNVPQAILRSAFKTEQGFIDFIRVWFG